MTTARTCGTCGAALPESPASGQCPECLIQLGLNAGAEPTSDSASGDPGELPRAFGDYTLLEEIARGGMGVVLKARQKSLDRFVAVKLILSGHFAGRDSVHRFRTEASSAAALQHPNIVAIHEVGVHQGEHYLAMDLVDGPNLAQFVKNTPLPAQRAARYLKTIAEAIHYAHERGILHRDLKPSNVLIDTADQPRVTDFGLAKRFDPLSPNGGERGRRPGEEKFGTDLTLTGQVLGSPNYIPPEQASGKRGAVSARSDVYSLGAILYHLLTGRGPFVSDTVADTLQQVLYEEPVSPRLLNRSVPRDLETICLKCLEKEQSRRYGTAQDLADDLGRFLCDESIHARPASHLDRFYKMVRRNWAVSIVASLLVGTLLLGTIISSIEALRARRAEREQERLRVEAQKAQVHAEAQEEKARLEAYASSMLLAHESLELNDVGQVHDLLEKARGFVPGTLATNASVSQAPWEWRHLKYETRDESFSVLPPQEHTVHGMDVSPDDHWLATGSSIGLVRLWELPSRKVHFEYSVSNEVTCLRYSPDGQHMVVGCADGGVRVFAVPSGTVLQIFKERGRLLDLRFSADGQRLAYASNTGWSIANLEDGTVHQWPRSDQAWRVAIAHDFKLFVQALAPQGLMFHRSWTNTIFHDVVSNQQHGPGAALSPNGLWLALALADHDIEIWSLQELRALRRLKGHSGVVETVAWSPDSHYLASGGNDQRVAIWDVNEGSVVRWLQGHQARIKTIVFSKDGLTLYTSASDRTVRIWTDWKAAPSAKSLIFPGPTRACLAADARFGCGQHSAGRLWFQTYPLLRFLEFPPDSETSWTWACSADGSRLIGVTGRDRGSVLLERTSNGFVARPVEHPLDRIGVFPLFSPDGGRVAMVGQDRTLGVWQIKPWHELCRWPGATIRADKMMFDPPGKRLFVTRSGRPPIVADVSSGEFFEFPSDYDRIAVSPDNRLAATTNVRGEADGAIWSAVPGEEPRRLYAFPGSNFGIGSISFTPDSSRLAIGLSNGQIKLWDFKSQITVGVLRGHAQAITELGFNSADESLVSLSADEIRVWRVVKE